MKNKICFTCVKNKVRIKKKQKLIILNHIISTSHRLSDYDLAQYRSTLTATESIIGYRILNYITINIDDSVENDSIRIETLYPQMKDKMDDLSDKNGYIYYDSLQRVKKIYSLFETELP